MKTTWGYQTIKERNLFLLCWIAYFSTYLCRLNYSAVMPEIAKQKLFTEPQIAMVSSCFFICYGIGQFINGILGDKLNPKNMVFWGLFISGSANIVLCPFHNFAVMVTLWGINGFVQSMIWSPILRLAGEYYDKPARAKFGFDISTTVPLGTLASYGISLLTMLILPWNSVFFVCGAIVCGIAIIWFIGIGKTVSDMQRQVKPIGTSVSNGSTLSVKQYIEVFATSGLFILLMPIALHGALKDSVTQWVPTFMNQQFSVSTTLSLSLTMLLPIINVTGAYFAKAVNRKLKNEVTTTMLFFLISFFFLIVLLLFGQYSLILTIACLAGVTNNMFAINVMVITMIPLSFSKYGCTSSMTGILNSVAYIGCGIANTITGYILNLFNWNATILLWAGMAIAAALFSLATLPLWKKFSTNKA